MYISAFGPSLSPFNYFAKLLIHSAFLLCSLGCHILLQNCLVSCAFGCWYVFCVISPQMLVEFPFVVLKCPVFSVLFYSFSISF